MIKKYIYILLIAFFVNISFTAVKSFSQIKNSVGEMPVSERLIQSNLYPDNINTTSNRCFVYISSPYSHQLYKNFLGDSILTPVGSSASPAYSLGAMTRNTNTGTLYVINLTSFHQIWSVDTSTGVWTQVVASCTGIPHANFTGFVFDHTTGNYYGLSSDFSTSAIFTVNMSTGTCTPIGTSSSVCAGGQGIYCAPNGTLFVSDRIGGNLYKVSKTTGNFILVGSLGFSSSSNMDGAFDLSDGTLYLTNSTNYLRICDTTSGNSTIYSEYPGDVSCLAIVGNLNPKISHTSLPITLNLSGPYVVNAVVAPAGSAISSSKIFWSRNNTAITDSVTMTNSGGNNWTGNIPGNGSAATYRYYIKAVDALGRAGYHPGGAPVVFNIFQALASDTTKPVITHIPLGDMPKSFWPATVAASVTDNIGIDSVWVRWYKNNNSIIKQFKLINTTGTNYAAAFNSLNSEVYIGDSIFYRIIAQDNSPNHNRDSSALYRFKFIPAGLVCLGTGTIQMGSSSGPYNTYWYGNRTQILYTKQEINAQGVFWGYITRIGFQISAVGGQTMNGLTFRMKNTTLTSILNYEYTGWTTVYTGNYTVPGTGWQYIDLTTNYFWDGTSNVIVEICFGNTSYTTATTVLGTAMTGMEITEYHDLSTACAYTGFTAPTPQTARANTCFYFITYIGINTSPNEIPSEYSLSQNYPNPFNPVTRINFDVPKQGFVSIKIYDILGREVKTLVNEIKTPGKYSVDFEADMLSSGVYFYRMESNGFMDIKRMVLIK